MTILVDPARWPWRDTMWCHLVSDTNLDELHEFAGRLGCRRVGFQGDHYDIDIATRLRAIENGAVECESRELVTKIRDAGLRVRPSGFEKWQLATYGQGPLTDGKLDELRNNAGASLVPALDRIAGVVNSEVLRDRCSGWFVLARATSAAIVVHGDHPEVVGPGNLLQVGDDVARGIFVRVEERHPAHTWSVEAIYPSPSSHQ